ncbi:MAG: hypothetical protein CMP08_07660 [Xanthomonadales bacterium]|nr:hypothetical protein [Xanthomonadales bacterium]|tara:strand:+ start:32 stop:1486 length:1455 start_codon:yes stop_codon:yes gene_type:complete
MLERIKHIAASFTRPLLEPAPGEGPMREAAGATLDSTEEPGFRRLSADQGRDLSPLAHDRMQRLAYWMWEQNNLANRLIELPVAYLLAEGVELVVSAADQEDDMQAALDGFWHDPINAMDLKLAKKTRELAMFGEQCWPAFVNDTTGHVRLGYLDPCNIATVVTDPDNIEQAIGVVTKKDKHGNARRYRVIVNGDDAELFTQRTQEIRQTFTDGDAFFFTVNDLSNSRRGRSDLTAQIDWVDGYDQFLFGELERADFLRAFIWDVELKGATPAEVAQRANEITAPNPGSVRVHNDSEAWKAESPSLNAGDTDTIARLTRNHVLGGATVPEHWFGGGGDVNRSTGESMSEPTFKMLSMRQRTLKYVLEYVAWFQLRQWAARGTGRERALDAARVEARFPEMTARDTSKYAGALAQTGQAVVMLIDRGLMSEATGLHLINSIASRLGVEMDCAQVLEDAKAEAAKRTETQYGVPGVDPNDPDIDTP